MPTPRTATRRPTASGTGSRLSYSEYYLRYAGAYVCKPKSQHRFGNAIDAFFDSLDHQDRVCSRAVELADELELQHVISRQRIWTKGVGWHPYDGDFHWHGHFDFAPNFATSLPCGVRG